MLTNKTYIVLQNINNRSIFDKFQQYFLYVIIVVGLIGNLISLFIFTRPNLKKKTNTGLLYTFLCIFNLFTLIEDGFIGIHTIHVLGYIYINFWCFTEFFIRQSLKEVLSWIQVLICFDRFILVVFPSKAFIMRKKVI